MSDPLFRMFGGRMKRYAVLLVAACMVAMLCLPGAALADGGDLGDADAPQAGAVSSSADANDSNSAEGLTVSADNAAALIDGGTFALDSFTRAQVGGSRQVDGVDGYCYYVGDAAGSVSMIACSGFAVVYVPADVAALRGFDVSNQADCDSLRRCLVALDDANANGGRLVEDDADWYFTTTPSYSTLGMEFGFDRELKPGQFYDTVLAVDAAGAYAAPSEVQKPSHACFTHMVPASEANIVAQPSWWESVVSFLQGIDYSPLWVTLKTTGTAIVFIFILGLAAAYFSLRISPRAQDIADSIFTIPMVLPPTVCGFLLLLAFGRNTPVGRWFIDIGFPLIFSWPATVIAAVVVAFPLMYRSARGAFESLDPDMLDAARTLGWSNGRIFFKLMLPLAWNNIASGTVLAFARALGEFGATLFLAGNYLGVTRTIPIAIYFEWMNGDNATAIFWTVVIILFSFVVILFINLWGRRTMRYRKGAVDR
jgi:molybdate transport system permease protein